MTDYGYHCSHEQIAPSRLLRHVVRAQDAGFDAAMCSDHLTPWGVAQGESGYAFSWLGAALASTELPFGVVTAPGQRTHPVTTAQAIATLGEMFPGRFWAALGSGEALNEHVTGDPWPDKATRERRLRECVGIIRALLAGEEVTHHGEVQVDRARVWSRPAEPPALVAAAVSPESAAAHAEWADGLITVGCDPRALREVVEAYREAGGRGPARLQVHLAWAPDEDAALAMARRDWPNGAITPPEAWDLPTPEEFDQRAASVTDDQLRAAVLISSDPSVHRDRIAELADAGFDAVMLHQVGADADAQEAFIDTFGERVLPELRSLS
ncbi:LLM class F420-dependent oxidoreductase [Microbacterium sp. Root53]|uniref:TIGR03885 family FMN-dependent LLM class oxidoreductase n=1 Tax=Microbacterium sp. Root53 TaxID=1736553 RepID=UPI0006F334EA|nr:TIGR03885 family FMN-dependent LLM class oxidoreductase [Microbacterium sp. Root53]KQY96803.1 LLM class F420-dependent oxidoreductase [Microbacterium sp. Root53]